VAALSVEVRLAAVGGTILTRRVSRRSAKNT
jgi:hypothetical protein